MLWQEDSCLVSVQLLSITAIARSSCSADPKQHSWRYACRDCLTPHPAMTPESQRPCTAYHIITSPRHTQLTPSHLSTGILGGLAVRRHLGRQGWLAGGSAGGLLLSPVPVQQACSNSCPSHLFQLLLGSRAVELHIVDAAAHSEEALGTRKLSVEVLMVHGTLLWLAVQGCIHCMAEAAVPRLRGMLQGTCGMISREQQHLRLSHKPA